MRYSEISERLVDPVALANRSGRRYGTEKDYGYYQSDTVPGKYIPLKNYDDDLAEEVYGAFFELRKLDPEVLKRVSRTGNVAIVKLNPMQPFVRIEDPELLRQKISSSKSVTVMKYRNQLFLWDGHHAALAAKLRGEQTVPAKLIDLDVIMKQHDLSPDDFS